MQLKQKISFVIQGNEYFTCGHTQNEKLVDQDDYYCCPDTEYHDDIWHGVNISQRCSKKIKYLKDWEHETVEIHVPLDANTAEKIALLYQQLEKALQGKRVHFCLDTFWRITGDLAKNDRKKICAILFGLPTKLYPAEQKMYDKILNQLPPYIHFCYKDQIINLWRNIGM